ncbi:MAG TPA: lipopolysaccharide heptosyltransferase II, partial [Candidatus Solibacter sp.]|nr:lipopolysaccharide heptosyltransferase II [Candidatus Solibacter sp.]
MGDALISYSKILVRATNWVGDAVMSLPALNAIRSRFARAEIVVLARPWVADIYSAASAVDRVIPYHAARGAKDLSAKWELAKSLRAEQFDCAILLQNAFEAALLARLAGIPKRIGYDRDARGWLLTDPIPVPKPGEIPRHQRFYYLELLRRAGILDSRPEAESIRLDGVDASGRGVERFIQLGVALPVIGVSPGAAYGGAKRWMADGFAAAAVRIARAESASVALFGSQSEMPLCESIAQSIREQGVACVNLAGRTALREFIDLAGACRLFLTNDSGAMHIASAAGAPTVAIFGATDDTATGPTGSLARVVRQQVECSP